MSTEGVPAQVIEHGLKQIACSGRVAKGFNCTVKSILKGNAKCVLLAEDVEAKDYKALITGLCKKHNVKLIAVPAKATIGAGIGINHLKSDGSVVKAISCGACAIIKVGKVESPELDEFLTAFELNKESMQ